MLNYVTLIEDYFGQKFKKAPRVRKNTDLTRFVEALRGFHNKVTFREYANNSLGKLDFAMKTTENVKLPYLYVPTNRIMLSSRTNDITMLHEYIHAFCYPLLSKKNLKVEANFLTKFSNGTLSRKDIEVNFFTDAINEGIAEYVSLEIAKVAAKKEGRARLLKQCYMRESELSSSGYDIQDHSPSPLTLNRRAYGYIETDDILSLVFQAYEKIENKIRAHGEIFDILRSIKYATGYHLVRSAVEIYGLEKEKLPELMKIKLNLQDYSSIVFHKENKEEIIKSLEKQKEIFNDRIFSILETILFQPDRL